ncbi:MAG: hypothetical protein J0L97_03860 [Alphaproteobacteria bacterium]|nr:hypothetical protein [Alphaproteobacteria bacterium]
MSSDPSVQLIFQPGGNSLVTGFIGAGVYFSEPGHQTLSHKPLHTQTAGFVEFLKTTEAGRGTYEQEPRKINHGFEYTFAQPMPMADFRELVQQYNDSVNHR